jgi:hypothetical protein
MATGEVRPKIDSDAVKRDSYRRHIKGPTLITLYQSARCTIGAIITSRDNRAPATRRLLFVRKSSGRTFSIQAARERGRTQLRRETASEKIP